jgi:hypothetical protein
LAIEEEMLYSVLYLPDPSLIDENVYSSGRYRLGSSKNGTFDDQVMTEVMNKSPTRAMADVLMLPDGR